MEYLGPFIVGWFGSVWWPGIERDAPPPKGDPWWWSILLGIVGGISAILVGRLVPVTDAMVGLVMAIGAGRVGAGIVGAVLGAARK